MRICTQYTCLFDSNEEIRVGQISFSRNDTQLTVGTSQVAKRCKQHSSSHLRFEHLPGGCCGKGHSPILQNHGLTYSLILKPITTFTNHMSWHVLGGKVHTRECSGRQETMQSMPGSGDASQSLKSCFSTSCVCPYALHITGSSKGSVEDCFRIRFFPFSL